MQNILKELSENYALYYWEIPTDINFSSIRLGDRLDANIVFLFDSVELQCRIERRVSREEGETTLLSTVDVSETMQQQFWNIKTLIEDMVERLENEEYKKNQDASSNELIIRTKSYINANFETLNL